MARTNVKSQHSKYSPGERAAIPCPGLVAFAERAHDDVVGIWKEVGSGIKTDRSERKKVTALAQDRRIDAVVVTELARWGRSTIDLIQTL